MATYNGEKYIRTQLESILNQLSPGDELIIVDDNSKDHTVDIIEGYNADCIKIFKNDRNLGHVKSFERALTLAQHDYICFSDQDDEWIEGRLNKLYNTIESQKVLLVSSNYEVNYQVSSDAAFLRLKESDSKKYLKNITNIFLGKAPYYGCTMMIHKKFKNTILPIPPYIEAHDLWMALAANVIGSNYHLESDTLRYRIHDNNTSLKKRNYTEKIRTRYYFLKALCNLIYRNNKLASI